MRDNYDFSDAIKNPFAEKKEKGKFNVLVTYDFNVPNNDDGAEDFEDDISIETLKQM